MDETDKRIARAIKIQRELGDKSDSTANGVIARETLHDELGIYGRTERHPSYRLDDETRDVLIVHGRQDASHAMANSATTLRRIAQLTLLVKLLLGVSLATLYLVAAIGWKLLR